MEWNSYPQAAVLSGNEQFLATPNSLTGTPVLRYPFTLLPFGGGGDGGTPQTTVAAGLTASGQTITANVNVFATVAPGATATLQTGIVSAGATINNQEVVNLDVNDLTINAPAGYTILSANGATSSVLIAASGGTTRFTQISLNQFLAR